MNQNLTLALIFLKPAWQAVCRPSSYKFRRRYTLRSALTALLLAPLAAHAIEPTSLKDRVSGKLNY